MAKNNFGKVINFIAFIGLCMVAIVLILQKIFAEGELLAALRTVGESIAYTITAISAFFYVKSKRNVWWYVAYTIALVLVIVFVVIR
ncbi:MAG: hypothetical protein E7376_05500 [Clostridiales bacterium]|nr:hypothetical protein [Clostridiales bacterium]